MLKNPYVLILAASYGEGHLQVSKVLKEQFAQNGVNNVEIVDLFAEAYPYINEFVKYVYLKSFTLAPSLYGWVYYKSKEMKHDRLLGKFLHSLGTQKLKERVQQRRPDVVINTFPIYVMPVLRLKDPMHIPNYTVITDFSLHQRWLHPEIDKYYVATEDLKLEMNKREIPLNKIYVSGIPIRDSFYQMYDKEQVVHRLRLDPFKKTILVMAGAYGVVNKITEIVECLDQLKNYQIVLACGKNEYLLDKMNEHFKQNSGVKVYGFIENIPELLRISECIITKPGGITLSEAIAAGVPAFLYHPVPGQEKDNAEYLKNKGAAVIFNDFHDFVENIMPLLKEEKSLLKMKANIGLLHKSKSGERIVKDILEEMAMVKRW